MAAVSQARRGIGRPSKTRSTGARDSLLDAALRLFAQQGIASTTFVDIAAGAGVTPAMVHYYFSSREQLLDALVEERVRRIVTALWAPVVDTRTVEPLLHGLAQRILNAAAENPWLPSLWLREVVTEGGLLRAHVLRAIPMEFVQHLIDTVAAAQRRGELNPELDPRLVFVSVLGITLLPLATIGVFQELPLLKKIDRQDIARHAQALLASAFAKRAPGRHRIE